MKCARICVPLWLVFLVAIWGHVNEEAAATQVVFKTSLGSIRANLFDTAAPIAVANFLKYVDDGDYDQTIVHRSVANFVIQGGGFKSDFSPIPADPPIVNESSLPNLRGTLSMATLTNNPHSATTQWFINLVNNSPVLDEQNGGYTVFGEILPAYMSVVDAIAALPKINANSIGPAFRELPLLKPFVPGQGLGDLKLVAVTSIDRAPEPQLLLILLTLSPAICRFRRAARGKA